MNLFGGSGDDTLATAGGSNITLTAGNPSLTTSAGVITPVTHSVSLLLHGRMSMRRWNWHGS